MAKALSQTQTELPRTASGKMVYYKVPTIWRSKKATRDQFL